MVPTENPDTDLANKNETELPIGEPRDAANREATMWRCDACGEMGPLEDGLPERCPECGSPREQLYHWEED